MGSASIHDLLLYGLSGINLGLLLYVVSALRRISAQAARDRPMCLVTHRENCLLMRRQDILCRDCLTRVRALMGEALIPDDCA